MATALMSGFTLMLRIPAPSGFHCEADEVHFFAWLHGIAAVKAVVGTPEGLDLTIESPIDPLSFYELVGLMTRYHLDMKSLRPLCDDQTDPWFRAKKNIWHESVFG